MSYDAGLVERTRDAIRRLGERGIREKNVFSGWGFLTGKHAFVIIWGEGMIVKVPRDEYDDALATPGVTPFAPGGDRPMGTWVVVSADIVADDPELAEWTARGLRGVRSMPEKPVRAPRSRVRAKATVSKARATDGAKRKRTPPAKDQRRRRS